MAALRCMQQSSLQAVAACVCVSVSGVESSFYDRPMWHKCGAIKFNIALGKQLTAIKKSKTKTKCQGYTIYKYVCASFNWQLQLQLITSKSSGSIQMMGKYARNANRNIDFEKHINHINR